MSDPNTTVPEGQEMSDEALGSQGSTLNPDLSQGSGQDPDFKVPRDGGDNADATRDGGPDPDSPSRTGAGSVPQSGQSENNG